jgi:predicted secreted Zn-dependent protease
MAETSDVVYSRRDSKNGAMCEEKVRRTLGLEEMSDPRCCVLRREAHEGQFKLMRSSRRSS